MAVRGVDVLYGGLGTQRSDVLRVETSYQGNCLAKVNEKLPESPKGPKSPFATCSSLNSTLFQEPDHNMPGVSKLATEQPDADAHRQERKDLGHVHWKKEQNVPEVGGVGWRTRQGHMLKNQAYYNSMPHLNKWDLPAHAGVTTWKQWHGPRLRANAPMMERLDNADDQEDLFQAKKAFVNTTRVQTLDRFYNAKLNRDQLSASQTWAPHHRARCERHECHEHFSDYDAKPEKELKKVLTKTVLERDRYACRAITKKIQREKTWEMAWKHYEQERRLDMLEDLERRRSQNAWLMQKSGQMVYPKDTTYQSISSSTSRTHELAKPKEVPLPADITKLTEYRGLIHVDMEHALESLFPGGGHELSTEFRARVTETAQGGWPPPPEAETPRLPAQKGGREKSLRAEAKLTSESVPVAEARLQVSRVNDRAVMQHSKAQFLRNVAPPPPDQKKTLLKEDYTPATMLRDQHRMTTTFQRTSASQPSSPSSKGSKKSKRQSPVSGVAGSYGMPPPVRSMVYPVLSPTSQNAKGAQAGQASFAGNSPQVSLPVSGVTSANTTKLGWRRENSAPSLLSSYSKSRDGGADVRSVCEELDNFEAAYQPLPRLCNQYGTPRASCASGGHKMSSSMSTASIHSSAPRMAVDEDSD